MTVADSTDLAGVSKRGGDGRGKTAVEKGRKLKREGAKAVLAGSCLPATWLLST